MTQEHRELLLRDLSGRFPSKVFVEDENAGLCVLQSYMLNDLMFEENLDQALDLLSEVKDLIGA